MEILKTILRGLYYILVVAAAWAVLSILIGAVLVLTVATPIVAAYIGVYTPPVLFVLFLIGSMFSD